jgi:hypothetical protein
MAAHGAAASCSTLRNQSTGTIPLYIYHVLDFPLPALSRAAYHHGSKRCRAKLGHHIRRRSPRGDELSCGLLNIPKPKK